MDPAQMTAEMSFDFGCAERSLLESWLLAASQEIGFLFQEIEKLPEFIYNNLTISLFLFQNLWNTNAKTSSPKNGRKSTLCGGKNKMCALWSVLFSLHVGFRTNCSFAEAMMSLYKALIKI